MARGRNIQLRWLEPGRARLRFAVFTCTVVGREDGCRTASGFTDSPGMSPETNRRLPGSCVEDRSLFFFFFFGVGGVLGSSVDLCDLRDCLECCTGERLCDCLEQLRRRDSPGEAELVGRALSDD